MADTNANPRPDESLAARLADVATSPREDLSVSRHVFQGEPCFVVRDPVTFAAHRFDPLQYEVLIAIGEHETLGEAFKTLVEAGTLGADEEEDYYAVAVDLHRSGLLTLPVSDHKSLYKRHAARVKGQLKSKILSPIFVKIPLCNPDAFFDRTVPFFRWMFTRWAVAGWAVLMAAAVVVAVLNRDNLEAPLLTVLELETLPLLWVLLIVLKVIHELGHGFACKTFGGQVPEIGAFLIAGTPAAYVDATASWGFHNVRHRVVVSLAGMYFESICAAIALFVWASTPPGMVNTAAFQVVIMASLVTIGFNINPLAKFDGYYLLSDLTGIPNLRERAQRELTNWFDRVGLGLPAEPSDFGPATRAGLLAFGVGAALYKITLVLGISLMVASKFFIIGVVLALVYVGTTVFGAATSWSRYLWFAPKTQPVRTRAIALSVVLFAGGAAAFAFMPIPARTTAPGVLAMETERTIRAPAQGIIAGPTTAAGEAVRTTQVLFTLVDKDAELALRQAESELRVAELELDAAIGQAPPAEVARAVSNVGTAREAHASAAQRVAVRTIVADQPARVIALDEQAVPGGFIRRGDPLATIGTGGWNAKLYLDEATIADADFRVGTTLALHTAADPENRFIAEIVRIADHADHAPMPEALAHIGGGTVMVDPSNGTSADPVVEVTLNLPDAPPGAASGARVWAAIDTGNRSLLASAWRGLRAITDGLATQ
ncbi:MAG: hypothetical protein AAF297_02205 [Planctomycetota bacterium]